MLEIGAGTGANLDYYPTDIELVVLEPSLYMQRYFKQKVEDTDLSAEIHTGVAEQIPFPNQSFDSVISTLVLCSVDDLRQSLSEIFRVLKPGGIFYFIEHVAASDDTWLLTLQNWITPLWKRVADGCHPNRETDELIHHSGFTDIKMEQIRVKLPVVSPHIIGSAAKPE